MNERPNCSVSFYFRDNVGGTAFCTNTVASGSLNITRNVWVQARDAIIVNVPSNLEFSEIVINRNVFHGESDPIVLENLETSVVRIAENTMTGGYIDLNKCDASIRVRLTANICGAGFQRFDSSLKLADAESNWIRNDNVYFLNRKSGELLIRSNETIAFRDKLFITLDPGQWNYSRLRADAIRKALPHLEGKDVRIGAVPLGPAPANGDWLTETMDRWSRVRALRLEDD